MANVKAPGVFVDKLGMKITQERWVELAKDESYSIIRQYQNESVWLRLVWVGVMTRRQAECFRETWPIFRLDIFNAGDPNSHSATTDGWIEDVETGKTFGTEKDALREYERWLEKWTGATRTKDGSFKEVNNKLAPPPPPDPDMPATMTDMAEGAW